jgi:integrase
VRTFCYVLAHTGCRISEALQLAGERIDFDAGAIVFESLKKRKRGVYRAVPVPPKVLDMLEMVHGLRDRKRGAKPARPAPLWPFGRTTAWKKVRAVLARAGVKGPQATPKGLRHGFGVAAIQAGIPLNLLQRWLGHAQLTTIAIYANAVGPEERNIAARMWLDP